MVLRAAHHVLLQVEQVEQHPELKRELQVLQELALSLGREVAEALRILLLQETAVMEASLAAGEEAAEQETTQAQLGLAAQEPVVRSGS